nr:SpoIIIAH-like family protein [Sporosarcina limicola]
MSFDGISIFTKETTDIAKLTEGMDDSNKKMPVFAETVLFEEMRMEVRNERSKLNDQLRTKIGSAEYTVTEKNEAVNEMDQLTKRNSAEALMEMEIKALGYQDAFVRTENGKVTITVLSTEGQSKKQANEIIHYVKSSWDDARDVQVNFTGET